MDAELPSKDACKLVPFSVPANGNEFYTYLSLAMYSTHDGHMEVRSKIWTMFLYKATGLRYHALDEEDEASAQVRADAAPTLWFCEWLASWYNMSDMTPEFVRTNTCARGVIASVKENMRPGCPPPALSLVSYFAANIYGIVIVLFPDYSNLSNKKKKMDLNRQVWFPENYSDSSPERRRTKFVHLLKQPTAPLQLLIDADRRKSAIPTRAISKIMLSPASSSTKRSDSRQMCPPDAAYKLSFFDPDTKSHGEVGVFSPPSSADNERICTVHRISVDVRLSKRNRSYTIKHLQGARRVPIFVFSVQSDNSKLYAKLIGFWTPDYVDPRIFIEDADMQIVIVPADNITDAERAIRLECGCMLATM